MTTGAMPSAAAYSMKGGASRGGSGRRRQAVGLSEKICSAVAPIVRARRPAFRRPPVTPRWIPTRGASGGQLNLRRGWRAGRATVRDMESRGDLLTIALLVFFLSMILIVAALLVLPMVVPGLAAA